MIALRSLSGRIVAFLGISLLTLSAHAQRGEWEEIHRFGPDSLGGTAVLSLAAGPYGEVYAGILQEPGSFRRSTNGWPGTSLGASHIEDIELTPAGRIFIAAYGDGVMTSSDRGDTWSANRLPVTTVWDVDVRGTEVLAATSEGLFRSTDGAETWQQLTEGESRAALITGDSTLLTGASGAAVSTDGGASWQAVGVEGDVSAFTDLPGATVVAGSSRGIFRSADAGRTWTHVLDTVAVEAFATDSVGTLYAAAGGVFRSVDGGRTWSDASAGLPEDVRAIALHNGQYDPEWVYAGSLTGRIYRRSSVMADTTHWMRYHPLQVGNAWEREIDCCLFEQRPTEYERKEVVGDTLIDGVRYYVYHWRRYNDDLSVMWHQDAFVRYDTTRRVIVEYVGTDTAPTERLWPSEVVFDLGAPFGAVLRHDEGEVQVEGGYWSAPEPLEGLPSGPVKTFRAGVSGVGFDSGTGEAVPFGGDPEQGYEEELIYVRLSGQEYGRSVVVGVEDVRTPAGVIPTLDVYPSPLRTRGTVSITLPQAGPARLALYDLLGRRLHVYIGGRRGPGRHEVEVEAAGLAPGTYFVRLETPEGVQTQPLIVVR